MLTPSLLDFIVRLSLLLHMTAGHRDVETEGKTGRPTPLKGGNFTHVLLRDFRKFDGNCCFIRFESVTVDSSGMNT